MRSIAALALVSRYLEYVLCLGVRGDIMHILLTKLHTKGIDPKMLVLAPCSFDKYIVSSVGDVAHRSRAWNILK